MPTSCHNSGSAKALSLQMGFRVRCYIAFQFRIDSFLHVVRKLVQSARLGRRPVGVSCIRRIVGASVCHGITSHGLVFRKKVRVSHRRRSIDPKASDQISPMHFPFDMICLPIGESSNCFCGLNADIVGNKDPPAINRLRIPCTLPYLSVTDSFGFSPMRVPPLGWVISQGACTECPPQIFLAPAASKISTTFG